MTTSIEKTVLLNIGVSIADRVSRRDLFGHRHGYEASASSFLDGKLTPSTSVALPLFTSLLMVAVGGKNISITIVRGGGSPSTVVSKINGLFVLTDATNITSITLTNGATVVPPPAVNVAESYRAVIV